MRMLRTRMLVFVLIEQREVGSHQAVVDWPHGGREDNLVDIPATALVLLPPHTAARLDGL